MPGVAFPPVGPLGLSSPPSSVRCAAKTATLPLSERFACRSRPDTLPAPVVRGLRFRLVARWKPPGATPGWLSQPAPHTGNCCKETGGSPKFLSYPSGDMPRSQTPVVSWALAMSRPGLLPSGHWKPSAFPSLPPGGISYCPRLYTFRGSITRPVSSLPPAPYSHCWVCTWSSLPTCWLGVGRVGLEPYRLAPTG
jgi:hypothetical protein